MEYPSEYSMEYPTRVLHESPVGYPTVPLGYSQYRRVPEECPRQQPRDRRRIACAYSKCVRRASATSARSSSSTQSAATTRPPRAPAWAHVRERKRECVCFCVCVLICASGGGWGTASASSQQRTVRSTAPLTYGPVFGSSITCVCVCVCVCVCICVSECVCVRVHVRCA